MRHGMYYNCWQLSVVTGMAKCKQEERKEVSGRLQRYFVLTGKVCTISLTGSEVGHVQTCPLYT